MNVKFAVGGASAIVMAVLLIAKRFNHLVDDANQAATVKCVVPSRVAESNERAERELEEFTHQRDRLVVVVFYAGWCFPSIDTKPVVESLCREFGNGVAVRCIDVDRAGSLLSAYQVEHVPDVRFFRHGEQIDSFTGAGTKEQFRAKFEELTGAGGYKKPVPAPEPAASIRSFFSKSSQPEPEPPPSGPGSFEPMKKGWLPPGMEKR
jgi:thioredoxin 1